ncbi:hypothetical protein M9Y10_000198 [Tritrichomonas musculus]|uniref:F5/8 type C domain-containing protein n=1 Tax=Tritrichomonas musculus TaxID=1915356 RepID=A0ABR2L3L8_9EUKA
MSKNCILILDGKEFPIQIKLKSALALGEKVSDRLFDPSVLIGKYYVQSKVSHENLSKFLDFLQKNQYPEIDANNYYDFLLLNEEFNYILSDHLSKSEFDQIKKVSMLKKASSSDSADKSLCEKYISENLDYYLETYGEQMEAIPCTTLYNIFQHEKRALNNQERAYQFIKKILEESKNNDNQQTRDICILLETLDGTKISEESLKESMNKRDERFGFAPKINFSFIDSFNNCISELKRHMDNKYGETICELMKQQQQMINDMKSYFDQKVNSIQSNYLSLCKKSEETQNEVKTLSNAIKSMETKIQSISLNNENEQKKDETNNKIKKISDDLDSIKSSNKQISDKCNETYNYVKQFPPEIKGIESNTKEILNKVGESLIISMAHFGLFKGVINQLTEEYGGNVYDKNIVYVTSSSCIAGCEPRNVVNFNDDEKIFISGNEPNSWLKYDFKSRKVRPNYYSIKSCYYKKGVDHPMNWVIEGSNSDLSNDWTILDSRNNINSLDESNAVQMFSIQKASQFYRYLRIRQTGPNSYNRHHLEISALEYFGAIQ